ncbi:hypothetical protein H1R20_g842, partial [Candolleomyces eurysporus]
MGRGGGFQLGGSGGQSGGAYDLSTTPTSVIPAKRKGAPEDGAEDRMDMDDPSSNGFRPAGPSEQPARQGPANKQQKQQRTNGHSLSSILLSKEQEYYSMVQGQNPGNGGNAAPSSSYTLYAAAHETPGTTSVISFGAKKTAPKADTSPGAASPCPRLSASPS